MILLWQVALLNMLTGRLEKSKELADELLKLCREVGDARRSSRTAIRSCLHGLSSDYSAY